MRLLGLSLAPLLLSAAAAQGDFDFSSCTTADADGEKCAQKMAAVVEVAPGQRYLTTIACKDCPYAETSHVGSDGGLSESRMAHGDQELFFNVSLASDSRSVLLNGHKIFPVLRTIPNPPHLAVPLLHPDFSYANLTAATTCSDPTCSQPTTGSDCIAWCQSLPLARMAADYSYSAHTQREEADAQIRFWDIVFAPVGGRSLSGTPHASGVSAAWKLDDPARRALHIVVAGQPVKRGNRHRPHNEDDGGLFAPVRADEMYSLEITKVEHVARRFDFPPQHLGFFGTVTRFFGGDVWKADGELVYLSEEWGAWGKRGTLRNWVGDVFHSNFVGLFFIVVGSVVGGFIALRVVQSAWLFAKQQRSLARWKGIDAVYSQLNQGGDGHGGDWDRRDRTEQDRWDGSAISGASSQSSFSGAWQGDYRDSYDDTPRPSPASTHERMKPLPTKPLPEKPLPLEPLIDT
ncbi:uncharacterized protein M421DRAFT_423134 [Didymella exigua CBS 183.55]|uniref:Uncharacterized protein n=1 Tax=Didymella exigua CBS 183.55 TaxID=1150837 RepID=A0A6A5RF81_9PLEO|nr:uncharacterized protein M421DRAFT_423134 [Didymella exigua CBS 183.55]KAF1926143.1 hypothetical protein M421DRAFT_423134 [Didymella exigua CBS 183.55]